MAWDKFEKLVELIKDNIATDSWDTGEASLNELRGTLLVRHTREVHDQIEKLLRKTKDFYVRKVTPEVKPAAAAFSRG